MQTITTDIYVVEKNDLAYFAKELKIAQEQALGAKRVIARHNSGTAQGTDFPKAYYEFELNAHTMLIVEIKNSMKNILGIHLNNKEVT